MRCRSFAKINLHLQVLARRPDGYHELLTIFQTIDLHDSLTVEDAPAGEVRLTVRGGGVAVDAGPTNLVHRAASAFLERHRSRRGVAIELEKRVPAGAGLGGGSSNAAVVLLALRARQGKPDRVEELAPLARQLGADVPFFLLGGTALGSGRGDEVRKLHDLPEETVLLALPPLHLGTADVFARARPSAGPPPPGVGALMRGERLPSLAALGGSNDLEEVALALHPELRRVPALLAAVGAERAFMTGSGSCFVGLLPVGATPPSSDSVVDGVRLLTVRTVSRAGLGDPCLK